jgi:hypothetical protein
MIEITDSELRSLRGPNQIFYEWKGYLQFVQLYFKHFKIACPLVVEIGTQAGSQKAHYERFLDATHIGIDISNEFSKPDILGDSHAPETMAKLKAILAGRPINLLFIDAFHTYEDAKAEYDHYGPLVIDIIAFHDIRHERGIEELWDEIKANEKQNRQLTFCEIGHWKNGWCELGIGIIVKRSRNELKEILDEYRKCPQA